MYAARRRQRHSVYNAAAHQSGSQALSFMPPSPVGTTTLQRQQDPNRNNLTLYLLGSHLIANHPQGFNMALYDHEESFSGRAKVWAKEQDAVGFVGGSPTANGMRTGLAISDNGIDVPQTLTQVRQLVQKAVFYAAEVDAISPKQAFKFKNIALFSHGWDTGMSVNFRSDGYNTHVDDTPDFAKTIAAGAGNNTNIILYACSICRGYGVQENWLNGTLQNGGETSLAGQLRDDLKNEGVERATVWGHTTVGHYTQNFALRSFSTTANTGTPGESYAMGNVFNPFFISNLRKEILAGMSQAGYNIAEIDEYKVDKWIYDEGTKSTSSWFYQCYAKANDAKTYKGTNLAEMAPVYPGAVAKIIREYWQSTYWPKKKDAAIKAAIKHFKLSAQGRNEQD